MKVLDLGGVATLLRDSHRGYFDCSGRAVQSVGSLMWCDGILTAIPYRFCFPYTFLL